MPMSDEEAQLFEQIVSPLRKDFTDTPASTGTRRIHPLLPWVAITAGVTALICGTATATILLGIFGYVLMLIGATGLLANHATTGPREMRLKIRPLNPLAWAERRWSNRYHP